MVKQTLKFQAIEFNNYRPYKNSVLEFSQDPKKTITVVEGRNAAGKTSIIHGIEWCLYGEEKIDAVSKGKPRCNINALNQLKAGESITTSVKITLSDNSGPKYQIERVLTGKKNFDAFFQTTIALTINKKITICFEGVVKGKISSEPLGTLGFHYDPIFIPNGTNKTYGQMSTEEKNKISHRAIAIHKLRKYLEKLFN